MIGVPAFALCADNVAVPLSQPMTFGVFVNPPAASSLLVRMTALSVGFGAAGAVFPPEAAGVVVNWNWKAGNSGLGPEVL